jgi:predicted ribosome quality control (RQC) complex YloA/Tae2 family protein
MDCKTEYKIEYIEIGDKTYDIYIGRSAKGNERIIKMSHPESLWFHLNNISSMHIVLESSGDDIPKRYINEVASKLFQYKNNLPKNVNVIYTKVKNVKLTNTLGTVIPTNTKLIKF